MIGHCIKNTWVIDATATRTAAPDTDCTLSVLLKGTTVSVNSQAALGCAFNAVGTDDQAGLFTKGGTSSFASRLVKTDDPKLQGAVIASAPADGASILDIVTSALNPGSSGPAGR